MLLVKDVAKAKAQVLLTSMVLAVQCPSKLVQVLQVVPSPYAVVPVQHRRVVPWQPAAVERVAEPSRRSPLDGSGCQCRDRIGSVCSQL